MIDWNDPEARFALIQRVGVAEFCRLQKQHQDRLMDQTRRTVATINGRVIKRVETRLGPVFAVAGTDGAFATLEDAQTYARSLPPGTA
jgi:hypothetical protein